MHEQIRNSVHTHTGTNSVQTLACADLKRLQYLYFVCVCVEEERGGSESSDVDLKELLSEVRSLRLQLERSIQTNTALRHKLEQQILTQTDPPSTININYLLHQRGTQKHGISRWP